MENEALGLRQAQRSESTLATESNSRMKKILLVTLLLAGMIISGSALQCYFCVPESGKPCNPTIEHCGSGKDTCFQGIRSDPTNIQKKCMRMEECQVMRESRGIRVQCCQTDLCNK